MYKLELDDGKYTIIEDLNNGVFKALRYGEEWQNLSGNNLVLSLLYKYQELEEENKELSDTISKLNNKETPKSIKKVATNIYECSGCGRRYYYSNELFPLEDTNYCDNCGQRIDFNLSCNEYVYGLNVSKDIERLYGKDYEQINNRRTALFYRMVYYDKYLWQLRTIIQNPVPITVKDFNAWLNIKKETESEGMIKGEMKSIVEGVEEFIKQYHLDKD